MKESILQHGHQMLMIILPISFKKLSSLNSWPIPFSQTPCVGVTKGTFNFGDDYYTLVLYYNYSYKSFHTQFYYMDIYLLLYDMTSIIMFLECFSLSFNESVSFDPLLINNHVNHIHCIHTCAHKHT